MLIYPKKTLLGLQHYQMNSKILDINEKKHYMENSTLLIEMSILKNVKISSFEEAGEGRLSFIKLFPKSRNQNTQLVDL